MSDEGVTRYDVDISVLATEVRAMNNSLERFMRDYQDHEQRLRTLEKAEEFERRMESFEKRLSPIERWQTAVPVSVITALIMSLATFGSTIFNTLFA
jgi:hypothetical protein